MSTPPFQISVMHPNLKSISVNSMIFREFPDQETGGSLSYHWHLPQGMPENDPDPQNVRQKRKSKQINAEKKTRTQNLLFQKNLLLFIK